MPNLYNLYNYITLKYQASEKAWEGVAGAFKGEPMTNHEEKIVWYMPLTENNEHQYIKCQNLQETIKQSPELSNISNLMEDSNFKDIDTVPPHMHVSNDMVATLYKANDTHLLIIDCYHVEYYLYRCILCLFKPDGTTQIWFVCATRHVSKTELSKNYITAEVKQEKEFQYTYCGKKITDMLKKHQLVISEVVFP